MQSIDIAKRGRNRDVAVLRHMALQQKSTYCVRRLMRDLKEIEENDVPTVGVSARPLEKDIKTWHANIRGPQGTPYQSGVFHLELSFPDNYPHSPPQVDLLTPLPEHPNVFNNGTKLCLDMLQTAGSKGLYQGWTSGYSVLSILLQLQSFLFEMPHDVKKVHGDIKKRVQAANTFVCSHPGCNHKGPIQAWPEFNKKETQLDSFFLCTSEEERLQTQTCCFHSRLTIKEGPLGVGISLSRLPRTGEIRSIESTLDLLSLKAYIKDSVRKSMSMKKFTHWLPLYLGGGNTLKKQQQTQVRGRTLHLARNALSMICQNSTRKFQPMQILNVLPKLLVTLVVSMMQEATHTSIRALRMWVYFVRLFTLMIEEYPEIGEQIDRRIQKFKESEQNRVKDNFSSLGDLLAYVSVSAKYSISDVLSEYMQESLDRQVFWMLRDVPELGDIEKQSGESKETFIDAKRDEVSFKTNIASNHILLFFFTFSNNILGKNKKNFGNFLSSLDKHYCQMSDAVEDKLQQLCEDIRKVKSFTSFFAMLGMKQLSKKELTQRLRKAVMNSLRKKYHGEDEQVNVLPQTNQMMKEYNKTQKHQTFHDFWDAQKKAFKTTNDNDPIWFDALVHRFEWIKDLVEAGESEKLVPSRIAELNDNNRLGHNISFTRSTLQGRNKFDESNKDNFSALKSNYMVGDTQNILERSSLKAYPDSSTTWRDVFLKLDFQDFLLTEFVYNPDFKLFYEYLQVCGPHISFLLLPVTSKANMKSGYYWMMVLLSKLKSLRGLYLYTPNPNYYLNADGLKYLAKGFNNFKDAGGRLEKFVVEKTLLGLNTTCEEKFGQITRLLSDDLKVFVMRNAVLTKGLAISISKMLSEGKKIVQLDLRNCNLGIPQAKEIADGLMRAKQLEVIKLGKNPKVDYGINYILYNLAFSPKIAHIDISQIQVNQRIEETAEAIYKLVKISGSLQTLVLNQTQIMHHLTREFWKVLGENATLKHLFIDTSSKYLSDPSTVGRFVALNAYKKGSLQLLSMRNALCNFYHFASCFLSSMMISDADNEKEYGDMTVANKMSGQQLSQYFRCNLKALFISNGDFRSNFDVVSYKRQYRYHQYPPILMRLMTQGQLEYFQYSSGKLCKPDADLLGLCLEDSKCTVKSLNIGNGNLGKEGAKAFAKEFAKNQSVQALDLSSNKIGVQGAKAVAKMLEVNKILRYVNLFSNNIDVDGARSLKDMLKVNCTLQCLDVGLNRLRKKGLKALAQGLFNNEKGSKLQTLGLKFNFLDDDSCQDFVEQFIQASNKKITSLKRIFIRKNFLSQRGLNKIREKLQLVQIGKNASQSQEEEKKEKNLGATLSIDAMEKMKQMEVEKLDRTIWVSPLQTHHSQASIKKFFEDKNCGIVLNVRIREGANIPGKPTNINRYAFVEFAHPTSVLRALRVASKKKSIVDGVRLRIYKAGTRTFNIVRPKKSKNLENVRFRTFNTKPTVNLRGKRVTRGQIPTRPAQRPAFRGGRGSRGGLYRGR